MCSASMMPSSSGSRMAALIQRASSVCVEGAGQPALSKAMICSFLACDVPPLVVVHPALDGTFRRNAWRDFVQGHVPHLGSACGCHRHVQHHPQVAVGDGNLQALLTVLCPRPAREAAQASLSRPPGPPAASSNTAARRGAFDTRRCRSTAGRAAWRWESSGMATRCWVDQFRPALMRGIPRRWQGRTAAWPTRSARPSRPFTPRLRRSAWPGPADGHLRQT